MQAREEDHKRLLQLVNKAVADVSFKERFIKDPQKVLEEFKISCRQGVEYVVVEDTAQKEYLVLPKQEDHRQSERKSQNIEEINPFNPIYPHTFHNH